ncbi:RimK family protein [Pseudoalteromonas piscicida]|uniref:Carboxylate--amine ligase n=1 Tax=Pseudoalteromonas piscicida TaxID=43662 RepID=A0A2A5JN66_PSEO7|nr:RimK family protein [Pseudoalteromonas piscicida]PCK30882.1 carboxylate--amine ligase [Pseudoalteromonas piscicida]
MLSTLFVVDQNADVLPLANNVVTFETYLQEYPKLGESKLRVINLCDCDRYLSQGYYCSLLAEARNHQVLPSLKVINGLRDGDNALFLSQAWFDKRGIAITDDAELIICMGETQQPEFSKLAAYLFQQFPAPLLKVTLQQQDKGVRVQVQRRDFSTLQVAQLEFCTQVLGHVHATQWNKRKSHKKYRWDIAMLVDHDEKLPPSNKGAISRFVKAGEKLGIKVHPLEAAELYNLGQYDGLFIRETTAIDHHTYRLAQEAEQKDLVVIDDPSSILRCCNKVFLHDAFNYKKVPSLETRFVSQCNEQVIDKLVAELSLPMVLKMPESSFSKGVFKVKTKEELGERLQELMSVSAIVLAQAYLYTDYDWRIGVLNGRAIYACRYHMARNHWQIYNHESKRNFSGGFDTLPTFEVPKAVLRAALKAAAVVGNGLYGIDIKEHNGKAYVLEVNDNPNIDQGVEDKYLGDELYMQVMSEFSRRLEARGKK